MKLLIWDFDGTLGYRDGMWSGTLIEIVRRTAPDRVVTHEQVRAIPKNGWPWDTPDSPHTHLTTAEQWWDALDPFFARVFEQLGFEPPPAMRMARQVRRVFPQLACWHLFDDTIPELREFIDRGWTHALLTNHVPELPSILNHLGLSSLIDRSFNSAETGYEKPHRQAFDNVLAAYPEAEAVWMIGDNAVADVAGAEAAGIPAILVRRADERAARRCPDLHGVLAFVKI